MKESMQEYVIRFLKEKNINAPALAKHIGTTRQAVYSWRDGRTTPNLDTLLTIYQRGGLAAEFAKGALDINPLWQVAIPIN